jgi:hypothetical protein
MAHCSPGMIELVRVFVTLMPYRFWLCMERKTWYAEFSQMGRI